MFSFPVLCLVSLAHVRLASSAQPISFPEATILLVSDGDRDFWQPLDRSNSGSPRFTDFPSLCACSESSLTNLIGSGLNLLCLQSHSKPECRWTWPGVPIFPAHDTGDKVGAQHVWFARVFKHSFSGICVALFWV